MNSIVIYQIVSNSWSSYLRNIICIVLAHFDVNWKDVQGYAYIFNLARLDSPQDYVCNLDVCLSGAIDAVNVPARYKRRPIDEIEIEYILVSWKQAMLYFSKTIQGSFTFISRKS